MRRHPGKPLVIAAAAAAFLLTSGCGEPPAAGPVVATASGAPLETAPPAGGGGSVGAGSVGAGSAATGTDPCAVLTAPDVEQVLGEPVDLVNDLHGCDYLTRGEPATLVGVSAYPLAGGTVAAFEELVAAAAAALPGSTTWPVSGLGEAATAVTTTGEAQLFVFVKLADAYLVFNVLDPSQDPQASIAVLQQLALAAVPRLESAARG